MRSSLGNCGRTSRRSTCVPRKYNKSKKSTQSERKATTQSNTTLPTKQRKATPSTQTNARPRPWPNTCTKTRRSDEWMSALICMIL